MRIDYREPRQYASGTTGQTPPRKTERSSSATVVMILVLLSVGFGLGFATGWHFSQKATKKAFRAAMEQQSLESPAEQPQSNLAVSQTANGSAAGQQQPTSQSVDASQAPQTQTQGPTPASPAPQVPLSFFDNLPRGQKQTVLGSGINEKPKPVPPPAVIPQPVQKQVAQPAIPTPTSPKPAAPPPATSGFVVQVASFNNKKDAEATRAKLAVKGYSATLSEVELNDKGTWYRVRIGRHLEKEAATEIATKIGGGAKVVPDQE